MEKIVTGPGTVTCYAPNNRKEYRCSDIEVSGDRVLVMTAGNFAEKPGAHNLPLAWCVISWGKTWEDPK